MTKENSLVIFQNSKIRRKWYKKEWWFSVVDVVGILINSLNYQKNRNYWKVLKSRLKDEGSQVVTECNQLKLKAYDEKFRVTDTANTKILLRIVQSIPSPKAEPFKLWLAQVGKERLDEIENPELAQERMKSLYEKKGYPKDWIDKRWEKYMEDGELISENKILSSQAIRFDPSLYIIHGQELKTNRGDVNVLFAEKRIPIEKSGGDFYRIIDAAKDCGENVLVGLNELKKCTIFPSELIELYVHGRIHFLESWNSMDSRKNNLESQAIAEVTGIPGIAVSDGHRLKDMGKACISINGGLHPGMDYSDLAKFVKEKITTRDYQSVKGKTSLIGKGLYASRLANAVWFPNN